jgi:SAM-dependent methyltransferase
MFLHLEETMKTNSVLDNQQPYWNRVANTKTFTHPIDLGLLAQFCNQNSRIVDFGCGYGRLVTELKASGYHQVTGYDTSKNLIRRGQAAGVSDIHWIAVPEDLPEEDGSLDVVLLFAVLTCIPSNAGQRALIQLLRRKLKPSGMLYISDYYLQPDRLASGSYKCLDDDPENAGVFTLAEGVTFRHHTQEWIGALLQDFRIVHETAVEVLTMNGNRSSAFQLIGRK